jgi:hypothetical protein
MAMTNAKLVIAYKMIGTHGRSLVERGKLR